jgi:hypothetical protein
MGFAFYLFFSFMDRRDAFSLIRSLIEQNEIIHILSPALDFRFMLSPTGKVGILLGQWSLTGMAFSA